MSARDTGTLLKNQQIKFCSQPLTLGSTRGGQSGLESVRKDGDLWLWGELGHSCQDPGAESLSNTAEAIFLVWTTHLHMASALGKAIALLSGLPTCRAHTLLRSPMTGLGFRHPKKLQGQ